MKLTYRNAIPVAAHRGNSRYYPENTLAAFRSALALDVDMLEIDLHMTSDGELILMHDHMVDRTTNGTGLIREKTLAEMKALDAGSWKAPEFAGEQVPTFREFLELVKDVPEMLFNIELKDYPAHSGDSAYRSAEMAVAMCKEYGIFERCVFNTWSGELNEWLVERYNGEIMIHAYSPQELMGGNQKRFVHDYAYCVCFFGIPEKRVVRKDFFTLCKNYGVEPWCYFPNEDPALYDEALENGCMLFTANDPKWLMDYLRGKGLHK